MGDSPNLTSKPEKKKVPKRTFVIEDVIVKDYDKLEPCLVQFSNGVVNHPSNLKGKLYRNKSEKHIRRRFERMMTVFGNRLSYTGQNFGENIDSDVKNRNFLGVLDKETNKMKLIEVSTFSLHPQHETKDKTSPNSFISKLNQNEKRCKLSETFGGRRERAAMRKREANKIDILDMAEALHNSTQKIEAENLEEFEKVIPYENILPPCDKNANLVENVYKLSDIIPDLDLVLYNDEALEYMDGNKNLDDLSPLVRQTIANAKLSTDEEETAKLVCIALFVENLIELLKVEFRQTPKFKSCPKLIERKIFSSFTEGKMKRKSKTMEDKLIAHIIILSLIANQFGLQLSTLCQSLSIKRDRLVTIVNIIGAKLSKNKESILLQIPLAKNNYERPLGVRQRKKQKIK